MAQPGQTASVTLRDYVRVVWLRKWVVALVVVACTLTAFFVSNSLTPRYTATALLMYEPPTNIANPLSTSSSTDVNDLTLQTQSVVNTINSPTVRRRAQEILDDAGGSTEDYEIHASILPPDSSSGASVSDVVAVGAESTDPATAAAAANAYAQAVIDTRLASQQARYRSAQDAVEAQMDRYPTAESKVSTDYLLLAQRLQDLQVAEASATGDFAIISPAAVPEAPSSPKPIQNTVVAFAVSLFAGVALAFMIGQFDTRVRTHREVGEILGLPVIGRVPRVPAQLLREGTLVTLTDPGGPVAESLRMLRGNLNWSAVDGDSEVPDDHQWEAGRGQDPALCNLAVVMALAGKKVVVIDADLRAPRVHRVFSLPNDTGLTSVMRESTPLVDALQQYAFEHRDKSKVRLASADKGQERKVASELGVLRVLTSGPMPESGRDRCFPQAGADHHESHRV